MVKILLLADYSRESERRLLRGLVKYANGRGGCALYQMSSFPLESRGHSEEIAQAARTLGVDAIFGIWLEPDMDVVRSLGIPVFLRTVDREYEGIPMLSGKYESIGRKAAEFFLRQRYDNLAFVGYKGLIWSDERLAGFSKVVARAGLEVKSFQVSDIMGQREELAGWLEELQKPAAIFACNDVVARTVSELCQFRGLKMPSQIALLGADNDEFLCNISSPTISSINLDFEAQGYSLGKTLFAMVAEHRMWAERIPIEPTVVIERESTFQVRTADRYVLEAIKFIDDNFARDINVGDIVSAIPLSRRAIELRFKREMGSETILGYLSRIRIDHFCWLLRHKDISIGQAALQSGFSDATNVGRIFKKIKGVSPSEYRKNCE